MDKFYCCLILGITSIVTITNAANIYRFIEQNSFICQLSEKSGSTFLTPSEAAQKHCVQLCGRVEVSGEACAEDELHKKIHCTKVPILCMRDFNVQYSGIHILKKIAEAKAKAAVAKAATKSTEKEQAMKAKKKENKKKNDKKSNDSNDKKMETNHTHNSNSKTKKSKAPTKRSSNTHFKRQNSAGVKRYRPNHRNAQRRLKDEVINDQSGKHERVDSSEEETNAKANSNGSSTTTAFKSITRAKRLRVQEAKNKNEDVQR